MSAMILDLGKFFIVSERILAVLPVDVSSVRRLKKAASYEGKVVDLTYGKRSKSVILTDSGHVIITSIDVKELISRIWKGSEAL